MLSRSPDPHSDRRCCLSPVVSVTREHPGEALASPTVVTQGEPGQGRLVTVLFAAFDELAPTPMLLAAAGYAALGPRLLENLDPLARLARVRASAARVADFTNEPGTPVRTPGLPLPDGPGELRLRGCTVRDGERV